MSSYTFLKGPNQALFIFGDHASRHIPAEYANLGLSGDDLTRHIAWDIGTETIARELCAHFNCAGLIAGISRLIIDLNRSPDAPSLIPTESDETHIPGNQNLTLAQRTDRKTRLYDPYHNALAKALDTRPACFALSIHSFTPRPRGGSPRTLDLGLLAKRDEDGGDWGSAEAFLDALPPHLSTAINRPYSAYDLNHTIDAHVIPRHLRHLAIEVRQDHIDTEAKATRFAQHIAAALDTII